MAILKLYKSTIPSINFILGNGKPCIFVNGRFATDIESEISALDYEIKLGHPHIRVDDAEPTIDSDMVDPMEVLRAKMRAEIIAEMAAATNPDNDMGTSTPGVLKPANSTDVAPAVAGGSGAGLAARLLNLPNTGK
jgi:hypothetical protein